MGLTADLSLLPSLDLPFPPKAFPLCLNMWKYSWGNTIIYRVFLDWCTLRSLVAKMPGCPGAQMPECPDALMPWCPEAQKPGCPDARMPRLPDAQMPGCPDAQMPRCPDAQKPRGLEAQMPRRTSIRDHPVQRKHSPQNIIILDWNVPFIRHVESVKFSLFDNWEGSDDGEEFAGDADWVENYK